MRQYPDNTRDIKFPEIQTAYPVYNKLYPTSDDYERGFFYRYYVKKANDNTIYEISKDNYSGISPLIYIKIAMIWKLTGKKNDVFKDKVKIYQGVYEQNLKQLSIYKKIMPGIENVIRDPLEFWKPS